MTQTYDVVVIGAGQSGLATAWHLERARLNFVVLEANEQPGGSWSEYYESLTLFSPARYSSLPGMSFPGPPDRYPKRDEVTAYLRSYAEQFGTRIRTSAPVRQVWRLDDSLRVETDTLSFRARAVVVAAGGFRHPNLPRVPGRERFRGRIIHSSQYISPDSFRGQRIVVVGAGNSAVQIACELAAVARVSLAVRRPVRFRPQRILGRDIHFWFRWTGLDRSRWLSDVSTPVLDDGRYQAAVRTHRHPDERLMFRAFYEDGVEWSDRRREAVDTVIFATGFRPAISCLEGLPVRAETGELRQVRGRSTTVQGLYFVGMPGQRNFASATLRGVGADARMVVGAIQRQLAASRYSPGLCARHCSLHAG